LGAIDLGESVAQAAARETLEESGIECEVTGIVGIYSDPKRVILYASIDLHKPDPTRPPPTKQACRARRKPTRQEAVSAWPHNDVIHG
jgi:ADP-ribose pyrophosphatase YjhB (NUDIX family)